jgi:hypothetical protein
MLILIIYQKDVKAISLWSTLFSSNFMKGLSLSLDKSEYSTVVEFLRLDSGVIRG